MTHRAFMINHYTWDGGLSARLPEPSNRRLRRQCCGTALWDVDQNVWIAVAAETLPVSNALNRNARRWIWTTAA